MPTKRQTITVTVSIIIAVLAIAALAPAATALSFIPMDDAILNTSTDNQDDGPDVNVTFDVNDDLGIVSVTHDRGDNITASNTGELVIETHGTSVNWRGGVHFGQTYELDQRGYTDEISTGDHIAAIRPVDDPGDRVRVLWVSPDGETTKLLGEYAAPLDT